MATHSLPFQWGIISCLVGPLHFVYSVHGTYILAVVDNMLCMSLFLLRIAAVSRVPGSGANLVVSHLRSCPSVILKQTDHLTCLPVICKGSNFFIFLSALAFSLLFSSSHLGGEVIFHSGAFEFSLKADFHGTGH